MYSTEVLKSNFRNLNNAYIVVRGSFIILGRHAANQVALKNCIQFTKSISKTDGTTINDAEALYLVIGFELFSHEG